MTLGAVAERKLSRLCEGLGLWRERGSAIALLRRLSSGWSGFPLGPTPHGRTTSRTTRVPFQYSVALQGNVPIVRILVEAQETPIHPLSSWTAGLRLNDELRNVRGFSLSRFELVRELFAPTAHEPVRFSMWHAAALAGERDASFKVYLNPQVRGAANAREVVREALTRLHLEPAWAFLSSRLALAGDRAQPVYFSLDLSSSGDARVEILRRQSGSARQRHRCDGRRLPRPRGQGAQLIAAGFRQLFGTSGPFNQRPVLVIEIRIKGSS